MWCMQSCYKQGAMIWEFSWVLQGRLWREDLTAWSWRISTVRIRFQAMAGEDTACWKGLHGCCGNLWIVEINGGAVIAHSSESCVLSTVGMCQPRLLRWALPLLGLCIACRIGC
jgi:hypothetical protein